MSEQHFPELPWKQIKGMRDHIAHGYFDIDADVIFHTVKNDIAPLRDALATIAEKLA